jgi:hypothetical protein
VSSTAGRRGTNRFSPDQAYYFARNPLLMAQRLGGRGWLLHGGLGFLGVIAPIYCLRLLAARDRHALAAYVRGLGDGLRRRSGKRPGR